jgi:hypothetical protein
MAASAMPAVSMADEVHEGHRAEGCNVEGGRQRDDAEHDEADRTGTDQ